MSAAAPLRAVPQRVPAESPGFTLADAIGLRVPLCYVVEADVLWADCAMEALLDESARARAAEEGAPEVTVARWTRTRRWTSYGSGFGFGLAAGSGEPLGEVDVVEELARLADHLAGARAGGAHALDGALFSVRGLQSEMERPLTAEVLLDLLRQLSARQATLLVELHSNPQTCPAWSVAASLGPVFPLPRAPRLRYAAAIRELRAAAQEAGAPEPEVQRVADALKGLTRLQAEVAARMARAESALSGGGADVVELLEAARERVCAVFAGTDA